MYWKEKPKRFRRQIEIKRNRDNFLTLDEYLNLHERYVEENS